MSESQVPEKVKALFKSSIMNCRYIFKDGKTAVFLNGEFTTDIQKEIDELNEEIQGGHPFLYRDENRLTVSASDLDPLESIRKKAIEDYKAELAAALKREDSESDQKFNIAGITNSNTVADAMSGSTSVDGGAQVAATPVGTASVATSSLAALKARTA